MSKGTYYIEWVRKDVRRRQSVKDSSEVMEQARRKLKRIAYKAGLTILGPRIFLIAYRADVTTTIREIT